MLLSVDNERADDKTRYSQESVESYLWALFSLFHNSERELENKRRKTSYHRSLQLWTSWKLWIFFPGRNAIIETQTTEKMKRLKVVEKLSICKLCSAHVLHRIHPNKLWIMQKLVQSFPGAQSERHSRYHPEVID
jgi:hypothetical protein